MKSLKTRRSRGYPLLVFIQLSSTQFYCIRLHSALDNTQAYKKAYLEPDFEVESGARVASGVEEAESDAAIDAAAEKDGDSEALVGNTAGEIRLDIRSIKALRRV